jgi:hypothetical protein
VGWVRSNREMTVIKLGFDINLFWYLIDRFLNSLFALSNAMYSLTKMNYP